MKFIPLIIFCWLCVCAPARAGDYTIKYAVDLKEGQEVGQMSDCVFDQICEGDLTLRNLRITARLRRKSLPNERPEDRSVSIEIFSKNKDGCCYFSDAVESIHLKLVERTRPIPISVGGKRRKNEYVANYAVGTLSVIVSDVKDEAR